MTTASPITTRTWRRLQALRAAGRLSTAHPAAQEVVIDGQWAEDGGRAAARPAPTLSIVTGGRGPPPAGGSRRPGEAA